MLGESGGVRKTLPTEITAIRSLSGVGAKVCGHRRRLGKPLLTHRATEGLFSTVGPQMSCEIGCLSERLGTDVTTVGLLPAVCPHVGLKSGGTSVRLPTDLTDVAPLVWRPLLGRTSRHGQRGVLVAIFVHRYTF